MSQRRVHILRLVVASLVMLAMQVGAIYADISFVNVAEESGINNTSAASGVVILDYDGDGHQDIYVANQAPSPNALYLNNGDGTFTDVAEQAKVDSKRSSNGTAVGDYDNDGHLDMYVVNSFGGASPNLLYHNNGDGTFTEIGKQAAVNSALGSGGGNAAFGDYDGDGDLDIYATSNGGVNVLYRNDGGGKFTDVAADSGTRTASGTVGASFFDYDNDGWLDIFVGDWDASNYLFRNLGNGKFENVTQKAGIKPTSTL